MKSKNFDQNYWDTKYKNNQMGWDIGYASPPIINYLNQLTNKEISILIPGAGNAYEVDYLNTNGFSDITVLDISKEPLINFKKRNPNFPKENLIQKNFFNFNKKFDLIIEQTFFCALSPELRSGYVEKIANLLNDHGKLVGLLFDFPLTDKGPPFGGSLSEYQNLFSKYFNILTLETCYNSIKPRKGRELFIIFEKKLNIKI